MKSVIKIMSAAICFVMAFGLTSCDKENILSPDKPSIVDNQTISPSEATSTLNADDLNAPKKILLSHQGSTWLYYATSSSLRRVSGQEDNKSTNTEYTYSSGASGLKIVTAIKQIGQEKETYVHFLNTKGKCIETRYKKYNSQGASIKEATFMYEYNEKGQLKKQYDKYDVNYRVEYTYDGDGNLIKKIIYGSKNKKVAEITYTYATTQYGVKLVDKYPLNPWELPFYWHIQDQYLPIFGKFNKHLVHRVTFKNIADGQTLMDNYFQYKFNAEGYVTERKTTSLLNNHETDALYRYLEVSPIENTPIEYEPEPID
jgi:hypothetical protein